MRIGFECMLTGPNQTGVGSAISGLLGALSQASPGDEFVVFTTRRAAASLPRGANIRTVISPLAGAGRAFRIVWQQTLARRRAGEHGIQLYHAPGYIGPLHAPIPTIVTVYDTTALEHPRLTTRANAAYYGYALPRSVRAAQRVIVPSQHVRRRLIELLDLPEERVHVIPLGLGEAFHRLPEDEARCGVRLWNRVFAGGAPFFVCVGNIERKKNLSLAIHALRLCRERGHRAHLALVGRPGNDYPLLKRLVRRMGLEENVHFVGYVDRAELVAFYSAATALLFPSLDEGFGFPLLEAMACNTPVLASRAGALPETAGDAALLLPPDDPEPWAAAMGRLLESESLAQELRRRGKARAAEFRWDAAAGQTLSLYRAAVGEGV